MPEPKDNHTAEPASRHVLIRLATSLARTIRHFAPGFYETFFGTDIFNRYTRVYVWYANQFGHFAIGFIFASISWIVATLIWSCATDSLIAFWLWTGFWVSVYGLKEVYDYASGITGNGVLTADKSEVRHDGIVDFSFVAFGAVMAGTWLFAHMLRHAVQNQGVFSAHLVLAVLASVCCVFFFFKVKDRYLVPARHFDRSRLPFYYRLPVFPHDVKLDDLETSAVADIGAFITAGRTPRSLCIHEGDGAEGGTGRTSLATGVAVALINKGHKVRYLSATEFIEDFKYELEETDYKKKYRYPPAEINVLVIDDWTLGPDIWAETVALVTRHMPDLYVTIFVPLKGTPVPKTLESAQHLDVYTQEVIDRRDIARPDVLS